MTQNLNFGTGADTWPNWPENFFGTEQFFEQIVQISVIFISNKSILMKIKEWYHVYLTSNKTEVTSVKLVLLKFVMLFDSLTKVDQLSEIVRFG